MTLGSPERSEGRVTIDLPVVALSLAALAHWIRGAYVDAAVFLVVALLVVLTERRGGPFAPAAGPVRIPGLAAVFAAGLAALVFGRYSAGMAFVVSLIGVLALFAGWREPSQPALEAVPRRSWLWAAVALGWCLWELISFIYEQAAGGLSVTHPTMSDLVDPMLANRVVQAFALAGWMAAGLAMLRATVPVRRS